jgi:uncharacterized protein DUF1570
MLWTILALCFGCRPQFAAAPKDGGPRWTELTSEHFTVWTDGDPARALDLIRQFERFHHVASVVAYPTAPSSGRALAIVVRNDEELSVVNNGGEARAFASSAGWPLWQPVVVLSLTASEQRTVVHELVHLVSYAVIHHQPRWLSEGMATYFESMQLDPGLSTVTVGAAPLRYGSRGRMVPVSELFDWNQNNLNAEEVPLYQTAWALFSFLINEHRAELAHYLWLIDRTGGLAKDTWRQQQRHTWNEAFPSLPVEQVDSKLEDWIAHGRHLELQFQVAFKAAPITARRLGEADTYAVRALVLGGPTPAQRERAREEIEHALVAEPTNALAWVLNTRVGGRIGTQVAQSITAAHPEDWRAWWLATTSLENAHGDPAELDRTRTRACALIAQNRALVAPPRLCPGRDGTPPSR